jgi:hypothetical protein
MMYCDPDSFFRKTEYARALKAFLEKFQPPFLQGRPVYDARYDDEDLVSDYPGHNLTALLYPKNYTSENIDRRLEGVQFFYNDEPITKARKAILELMPKK